MAKHCHVCGSHKGPFKEHIETGEPICLKCYQVGFDNYYLYGHLAWEGGEQND